MPPSNKEKALVLLFWDKQQRAFPVTIIKRFPSLEVPTAIFEKLDHSSHKPLSFNSYKHLYTELQQPFYRHNYPNCKHPNYKNMQLNLDSTLLVLTTFLIPTILARCPVCFDNTVRGCDGFGPDTPYYTCYKTSAGVHMVSTFTCDGGCRLVMGQPRCNNGKHRDDMITFPLDPKCPWGLREVNGKTPSRFIA